MEETIKLIKEAHAGDKEARDRLVTENMGLVWSIVRRFSGRGHELEDLFQIGSIGLLKAIDKFDPSFEVRFSTYAVPMITGEIKRFLRDDGMIKVSRSLKEMSVRIQSARESMTYDLGREPTLDEIAQKLEISREEVAASLEARAEIESIYRPVGDASDTNTCLLDKLEEKNNGQEKVLDRIVLETLLSGLNDQEKDVILRRYYYSQTQAEIAAVLHISQVQVSRLEKRILKKMREQL